MAIQATEYEPYQPIYRADNGVIIEIATGLIAGVEDPETGAITWDSQEAERFAVDTLPKLEWVLERFQAHELAIEARKQRRQILLQNLAAMDADDERDLKALHWRFDAEIDALHARLTADGKTKTIKTTYGQVARRWGRAAHTIADMELAVEWAESNGLDIVRVVKTVGVTDVLREWEKLHQADPDPYPSEPAFVATEPAVERVTINVLGRKSDD